MWVFLGFRVWGFGVLRGFRVVVLAILGFRAFRVGCC